MDNFVWEVVGAWPDGTPDLGVLPESDQGMETFGRHRCPNCNAQEFEQGYCERSKIALADYRRHLVTLPCTCDDPNCPGWAAVGLDPSSVRTYLDLYWKTE